jgi:thioredoxin reductase (NADPH)
MSDWDTVVIGGGVGGLTAALFTARYGCSTLVLLPLPGVPGGQLVTIDRVEDFPGFPEGIAGYELGPRIQEQAASAGAEFRMAEAESLSRADDGWRIGTSDGTIEARTIVVASGSRPRQLGVPGEERLVGRGVSHCASCDGPLLRGKSVTVVGAGDSGLQEALTLSAFASHVLVVHSLARPSGQESYQQRVRGAPNVDVRGNTVVEEVLGEERVTGAVVRDTGSGATETIETSAVFVYVGLDPNTAFLRDAIHLDDEGRIPTDVCMRTELPGIFAVGDVRSSSARQAVTAAGDGGTAAIAVRKYISDLSP